MSDSSEVIWDSSLVLPPTIRAELAGPPLPRRPWYRSLTPAYLMLAIWAPFFDRLWAIDLPRASLSWLAGNAVLAATLSYGLLFCPMAMWGFRARQRLGTVAASTFGTSGSEGITGVAIAAAAVLWYAAAIDSAIEYTLLGLASCGLLSPQVLGRWDLGPIVLKSPVFLCTAMFWIFITGMVSVLRLAGVIVALMRVYAPVALLLLTVTALALFPGLGEYRAADATLVARASGAADPAGSTGSMVVLVFGFLALSGFLSVDWGVASRWGRDVVLGGLTGLVLAISSAAVLSLVIVAGAVGRLRAADRLAETMGAGPPLLSFRWAVWHGIGGVPAGVILILFGLVALAPACWCSGIYSRRLAIHWPGVLRIHWTWIGGATAWLLIATSWAGRVDMIAAAMGLVFAPAVGAMAGDFLRQRGGWAGIRSGLNPPGVMGWAAGLALSSVLGMAAGFFSPRVRGWLPPGPIAGFLTAVLVYWLLAGMGLERPSIALEEINTELAPAEICLEKRG